MKIGELREHCGECPIMEFCTEPWETPELCTMKRLRDIDVEEYKKIAGNLELKEVKDMEKKLKNSDYSYDRNDKGAICELVIKKLGVM